MFNCNSNSHSNTQYTTTSSSTEYTTPIQNTQQPAPIQNSQLQYTIHNNQLQYRIHNSNTQYTTTSSNTQYTTSSSNTQYTTHRTAKATSNLYHLTNSHHNNYFYINKICTQSNGTHIKFLQPTEQINYTQYSLSRK